MVCRCFPFMNLMINVLVMLLEYRAVAIVIIICVMLKSSFKRDWMSDLDLVNAK